jgi:alpha-tubulin suppressor-like RCC1 family protein
MPTTSFRVTGADLDTLFEPIGGSSKRADVNYTVGGTDISNYYYSVANGGTAFGTTSFQSGGVDIGTMFAAIGTIGPPGPGFLYVWGNNTFYQLGVFTGPTDVYNWTKVAGGNSHTVAIRSDGLLFTWGRNNLGQLGEGSTLPFIASPVQIGSSSWTAVSAGTYLSAAIRSDGRLFLWGRNNYGQLGDNTTIGKSSPVQIGSSSWTAVSAGGVNTAAIRSDGLLFLWGRNTSGQLGDGTTVSKSSPVQIGSSSWTAVDIGGFLNTAAIRSDGLLFAWGSNFFGQLTTEAEGPASTIFSWTAVSTGATHTAAIRSDGL